MSKLVRSFLILVGLVNQSNSALAKISFEDYQNPDIPEVKGLCNEFLFAADIENPSFGQDFKRELYFELLLKVAHDPIDYCKDVEMAGDFDGEEWEIRPSPTDDAPEPT